MSLPAPLAIKVSARRETDWPVTDPSQSCEKSSDSDHWPVNRCISSYNVLAHLIVNFGHKLALKQMPPKNKKIASASPDAL